MQGADFIDLAVEGCQAGGLGIAGLVFPKPHLPLQAVFGVGEFNDLLAQRFDFQFPAGFGAFGFGVDGGEQMLGGLVGGWWRWRFKRSSI